MRYADLVHEVWREAHEAPAPVVESELRDSAIAFCKESRVWRESRTIVVDGQPEYRLRPSQSGRVDQVVRVMYVNKGTRRWLIKVMDREMGRPEPGDASAYSHSRKRDNAIIRLSPIPADGEIDLVVALVPKLDSDSIPDFILEEWRNPIVDGAIARLLAYSNKPWTDPGNAERFRHSFLTGARDARQQAVSDDWTHQTVKLRQWV